MKSKIKNIHNESISLFVKVDGIEKLVSIPAGESMIIDTYDTKTIRVFRQRGFITVNEHKVFIDSSGNLNLKYNPEPVDEDIYLYQRKNTSEVEVDEEEDLDIDLEDEEDLDVTESDIVVSGDLDRLEIVEGEVEKYIEGGYIKGEWTDEDIEFLRKNYPNKGRKFCSTHLNRNESSVQKKINALDLKKKKKRK